MTARQDRLDAAEEEAQAPPCAYYAIRQARTRVIGSRRMTLAEAAREVDAWTASIGPARAVPATTPGLKRAVNAYDQAVLVPLLYPEGRPGP